jgi:transcriptional regulator with XRE-family HTH domain
VKFVRTRWQATGATIGALDDRQLGAAIRMLRLRRHWSWEDLATVARSSRSVVPRIESGHVDGVGIDRTRRIAAALDARASVDLRWRGGELARLLDQRHAAMQDRLAARLTRFAGWQCVAEARSRRTASVGRSTCSPGTSSVRPCSSSN